MGLPEVPLRNWVLVDPQTGEMFEHLMTKDWVRYLQTTAAQIDTNETGIATNKTKLDGYINVVSQGAVGDGETDDTAAIQAAITACPQGGMVYIPPCASGKFYKLTETLTVDKAIRIVGAGYHAAPGVLDGAVLQQTGSGQAVFDCQAVEGLVIEHLALGGGPDTLSALNLQAGVNRSVFNDLLIPGAGSAGLSIAAAENALNTYESVRVTTEFALADYATPTTGIRVVGGPNLWSNCSVDGASIGINLHGYGTWVGLRLRGCVTGITWSGDDTNIGNVFLNASAVSCGTVHNVVGTPTESRAMSLGDGSGDNAFALPSTVGVNLRATMTTSAPTVSMLTSGDPVFLAASTESAATAQARLEVRDVDQAVKKTTVQVAGACIESESETDPAALSFNAPLVVKNTRTDSTNTNVIAQFISPGEHQNSVVTLASDDDRSKLYARHAIDVSGGPSAGEPQTIKINSQPGPVGVRSAGANVAVCGGNTLNTTSTQGFLMIPTASGDVTAVPAPTHEGSSAPFYFDTNNNRLWVYNYTGGSPAWKYVELS